MDLENLIKLAHEVAKPWKIATYLLAFLLVLSLAGNIYLATQSYEITIEQDNSNATDSINYKG